MVVPPEETPPEAGASQRLAAQRRRGVRTTHVRFPGRDLRPSRPSRPSEVPEVRTPQGRQILVAVAGAALLVREVARRDWGGQEELAARKAWDLLGGMLAHLESSTPKMHAELARRNGVLLDRIEESLGGAETAAPEE